MCKHLHLMHEASPEVSDGVHRVCRDRPQVEQGDESPACALPLPGQEVLVKMH